MLIAQVDHSSQRRFYCYLSTTGKYVWATAPGNLLKGSEVVVGDFVRLEPTGHEEEYLIVEVLPRSSEIYRIFIRDNRKKVVASNCDVLVIVTSIQQPTYKQGIIDRYLIRSFQWGVPAIVIFNKADLLQRDTDLHWEASRLALLKVPCFEISAILGDRYQAESLSLGLGELKEFLTNKTALFVGQSGVGKSELISALTNNEITLKSRSVGKKGKGTHTTTWSEMVRWPPSLTMIDSPGIRSFSLEDVTSELLVDSFPEIAFLTPFCQFGKCNHDEKAQGCVFLRDDLESFLTPEWEVKLDLYLQEKLGKILDLGRIKERKKEFILSRLDTYRHIYNELKETPFWNNVFLRKEKKAKSF